MRMAKELVMVQDVELEWAPEEWAEAWEEAR
jgi:hypothetical protein